MSKVEVNEIRPQCGTTVTLGGAGETVALGACASATGFSSPCMSWCSSVKTAGFTAVAGNGYFINTCGGAFEVTLPATASVGDEINFTDFARTWGTACKELTLNQNSLKFQGNTSPKPEYDTAGATVKIVYSGTTQGWIPQLDKGTVFETPQSYNVRYTIIAGGGAGAPSDGGVGHGGGGAGGYRTVATKSFAVTAGSTIPVTIGAGGTNPSASDLWGGCGTSSIFSTITSAGGGGGSGWWPQPSSVPTGVGMPGGSGGGGSKCSSNGQSGRAGGTGNDPCVSPPQGNDGGNGGPSPDNNANGGGGGGAGGVGEAGGAGGGDGGVGIADTIFGSSPVAPSYGVAPNPSNTGPGQYFAGGGAGGWIASGVGGYGGGGAPAAGAGTVNTGGGAGAAGGPPGGTTGGTGGSGIVVIRRLTACSTSTSGNATGTCGSDTIHIFTGDGTFVA